MINGHIEEKYAYKFDRNIKVSIKFFNFYFTYFLIYLHTAVFFVTYMETPIYTIYHFYRSINTIIKLWTSADTDVSLLFFI